VCVRGLEFSRLLDEGAPEREVVLAQLEDIDIEVRLIQQCFGSLEPMTCMGPLSNSRNSQCDGTVGSEQYTYMCSSVTATCRCRCR